MSAQLQNHSISPSSESDDEYDKDVPSDCDEDRPTASHQTPDQHQQRRCEHPRSSSKIPIPQLGPEVQYDFSILFHIFLIFFVVEIV